MNFYDYNNEISFEKYQQLKEKGYISLANAFSVSFSSTAGKQERFMFRYRRNRNKFVRGERVIPLELTYNDRNQGYIELVDLASAERIRIRELYFTEKGEFVIRFYDPHEKREKDKKDGTIAEAVQWFYDDILKNVFGLS